MAVITNQAGVARGYFGLDDVHKVHQHIAEYLAARNAHIDLFLFCPYHPEGTVEAFARYSSDRKPEPGMALAAAHALDLDLRASWVIGDHSDDMRLAAAVGSRGIQLGPEESAHPGARSSPDLATAAQLIVERVGVGGDVARPLRVPIPGTRPKFPIEPFSNAALYCRAYFTEAVEAAASIDLTQVEQAAKALVDAYDRGALVFSCGNGGSASIANHLQCDHLKGVRTGTELWPRVQSLSSNTELLMAIANDISYDDVFVYQLQSQARAGDVLVAISSSGRSQNIVRAMRWARDHEVRTICLSGFDGGEASALADISVHVDSANYGVVEDAHQATMHLLAQYIRQSRMSPEAFATYWF